MNHTKELGPTKLYNGACFLTTGSAAEKFRGIHHLFEHILVFQISTQINKPIISGHTTEDYIVLFYKDLQSQEIFETIMGLALEADDLALHKEILIREIQREEANEEEGFFRTVWQSSNYENSPLGDIIGVEKITVKQFEEFRSQLLGQTMFFYRKDKHIEVFNKSNHTSVKRALLKVYEKKKCIFKEKPYDLYFFTGQVEEMYFLEKMLQLQNQDLHIQLSEKKDQSVLIVEQNAVFPNNQNINTLRQKAIIEIRKEIKNIKVNFQELVVNELESIYFYSAPWSERTNRLSVTTHEQLLTIIGKLNDKKFKGKI